MNFFLHTFLHTLLQLALKLRNCLINLKITLDVYMNLTENFCFIIEDFLHFYYMSCEKICLNIPGDEIFLEIFCVNVENFH